MKKNLMKRFMLLGLVSVMTYSMVGCSSKSDKETFTIAYAPNESTQESADARKGLEKELEKAINMDVEEIQASDYNSIIEALRTGKADMAYMGSLSVALAKDRAQTEPIVMKAENGDKSKSTYKSLLITSSKNKDINSIKDIKGKRISFVDPDSTSGNLIPTAEIIKAFSNENLNVDTLHTNGKFFEASTFSGKHQAGLQAVIKGDVDIVPISDQILQSEIESGNAKKSDIKVIHTSAPIPGEAMIVKSDMDKTLKNKLIDFLTSYDNEQYFNEVIKNKEARFIKSGIEDYKDIIELNKSLNK